MEVTTKTDRGKNFRQLMSCHHCDTQWQGPSTTCPECRAPWRKRPNWSFISELILIALAAGMLIWFTAYS